MFYPNFIKKGDFIGVTASSAGVCEIPKLFRLDNAIKKFNSLGFNVIETPNVRINSNGRSSTGEERAKELESLFLDKSISLVTFPSGGDFLIEMLSYIDFDIVKNNPKWIQGFSDPTSLLFYITTFLDISTIYSNNFCSFGMKNWHKSLENNLEILSGNIITQNSFDKYQEGFVDYVVGDEEYDLNTDVEWLNLNDENSLSIHGRIIGGCLDCLISLIGTRFDNVKSFIHKYRNDGIIWYFDNFSLDSENLVRAMWQFKEAGWFDNCSGIIFGRSLTDSSCYNISFKNAVKTSLSFFNVPIILNADISHKSPSFSIINGSVANIASQNKKGVISFNLI